MRGRHPRKSPWRNCVDSYAVRRPFGREIASQPEDRALGGAVTRQLGDAAEHRLRDGVDDAPVAGSRHDDHTVVEAQLRHDQVGTSKTIGTDVGDRKA